jgi:hypothetical protein
VPQLTKGTPIGNCGTLPMRMIDGFVFWLHAETGVTQIILRRLSQLSTAPPPWPGPGGVGKRIEEAIELIEMEVRHAAAYVNAAVIPQVRSESISALRNVANSLKSFADKLDRQQSPAPGPQPPNPERDTRP